MCFVVQCEVLFLNVHLICDVTFYSVSYDVFIIGMVFSANYKGVSSIIINYLRFGKKYLRFDNRLNCNGDKFGY